MGGRCSEKVDIFSFGVVLWEIVTGESPARGRLRSVKCPPPPPPHHHQPDHGGGDASPHQAAPSAPPALRGHVLWLAVIPLAARLESWIGMTTTVMRRLHSRQAASKHDVYRHSRSARHM